jgi:hypothetical protein
MRCAAAPRLWVTQVQVLGCWMGMFMSFSLCVLWWSGQALL